MRKLIVTLLLMLIPGILPAWSDPPDAPPEFTVPTDATILPFDQPTNGRVKTGRDHWFVLTVPDGATGDYVIVDMEGKTPDIDIDLAMTDRDGHVLNSSTSTYRHERVFARIPDNRRIAVRVFIYQSETTDNSKPRVSHFALRAYALPQPPLGPFAPTLPSSFTDIDPDQTVNGMVRGTPAWYRYHIEDTGTLRVAFQGDGLQVSLFVENGSQVFDQTATEAPLIFDGDANVFTDFFVKINGGGRYTFTGRRLEASEVSASEEASEAGGDDDFEATGSDPAPTSADTTPTLTVLFSGQDAASWGVTSPPTALSISPRGNPVMAVGGNLFDLSTRRFLTSDGTVSNCAYSPSGALLVVKGRSLGYYAGGAVRTQMSLPETGMKIAAGINGLYVFGGDRGASGSSRGLFGGARSNGVSLYFIDPTKGYVKLFDMPQPIEAASVRGDILYFSVANDIYRFVPGAEMQLVCRLPGPAITSIAADADESIFFTAGRTLYSWRMGQVGVISENIGDLVSRHSGGLYVLDTRNRVLVRFDHLP